MPGQVEDGQYVEKNNSKAKLVAWIEQGGKAYVEDRYFHRADVQVVIPEGAGPCQPVTLDGL